MATIQDVTAGESLSPAVIVVGETAGAPMLASQPPLSGSDPSVVGVTSTAISAGPGGGDLVDQYDTWLLDLDGVLWGGQGVVEGSVEAVAALMRNGRVFYVTNNSARTRKDVAAKLTGLGFTGVLEDDVITSGWAAAEFLSSQEPPCRKVDLEWLACACLTLAFARVVRSQHSNRRTHTLMPTVARSVVVAFCHSPENAVANSPALEPANVY